MADNYPGDDWFRVEVSDRNGQIVAIETEMLAGRDIGDAERRTIRKAIANLSGFLGGEPNPDEPNPDECSSMIGWDDRSA